MFSSDPVSRLSTQMTRCPSVSRWSQRCDPRNPAPPVTTEVGIRAIVLGKADCSSPYEPFSSNAPGKGAPTVFLPFPVVRPPGNGSPSFSYEMRQDADPRRALDHARLDRGDTRAGRAPAGGLHGARAAGHAAGEWVGGIVAEASHQVAASKTHQKASVQIKIRDLTIVAVEAKVPGAESRRLRNRDASPTGGRGGFQQLFVHFASRGNVLLKPTGRILVFDSNNKLVETLPFTMDTFLPRTAIDYPLLLKTALRSGDYRAAITLRVPGVKAFTATRPFSVSQANVKEVFTSASPTESTSSGSSSSSTILAVIAAVAIGALIVLLVLFLRLRRRTA